nr:acetylornithine deacetylase [Gammaproteobacteria bacterium]
MQDTVDTSIEILEKLVSFESVSAKPTHQIIGFVESYLAQYGVKTILSYDEDGERANVFATIGPQIDGGV